MSTSPTTIKPVFSTAEEEPLLSKPVSKLAILSLVLGVVGLLTPITGALTPIAIAATLLGLVSSFQLSRPNSISSGGWIANSGLFLGLLSLSWFGIANKTSRDQMAEHGSKFAIHFLENLAAGNIYVAAELQQPLQSRQLAGLDLAAYYESLPEIVEQSENSSPDPKMLAKMRITDLRKHQVTKYAQQFPKAKWIYTKLDRVSYNAYNMQTIVVVLSNSEDQQRQIAVTLERQFFEEEGKAKANWYVKQMKLL